jgi:hypothetical protein
MSVIMTTRFLPLKALRTTETTDDKMKTQKIPATIIFKKQTAFLLSGFSGAQ